MNVQRVCFNTLVVICTIDDTKTRYIVYIDVVTQDGVCFEIERLEHLRKENDFWQSEKK